MTLAIIMAEVAHKYIEPVSYAVPSEKRVIAAGYLGGLNIEKLANHSAIAPNIAIYNSIDNNSNSNPVNLENGYL